MHDRKMDIGQAIDLARAGAKIARHGWNGKDMWIAFSPGHVSLDATRFWSAPVREWVGQQPTRSATVLPCFVMKTASDEILIGWLASQSDLLATDWFIVE